MSNDLNPYAAPNPDEPPASDPAIESDESLADERSGQIWRDGGVLVVPDGSELPMRCVKCNAPAERWKQQRFHWLSPELYYTLLLGPAIFIIVYMIARRSAAFRYGICHQHWLSRKRAARTGTTTAVSGLALTLASACLVGPIRGYLALPGLGAGVVCIIVGSVIAIFRARLLWPSSIDAEFAWMNGASDEFLDTLPELPG